MSPLLESPVSISLESAGLLLTPEEFDAINEYDEHYRYELIHGVLVVSPIPSPAETGPNELLAVFLWQYQRNHPSGHTLDDTLPQQYVCTPSGRRLADRLIWTGLNRLPDTKDDLPTIAVEFVSGGRRNRKRDYEDKRTEYREAGLKEYWIFDRFAESLTVISYKGKKDTVLVLNEGDEFESPLLPGFVVPIAEILTAAKRRAK